jgi:hypothetical protein
MVSRWKLLIKKTKIDTASGANFHISYKHYRVLSQSHVAKFRTQQPIKILEARNLNISNNVIIVWVVGVAAGTSRHVVELVRL